MTVVELYRKLNEAISSTLSLDWDNDGLMCCPIPDREVNSVLCVLDVTPDTVHYAIEHKCDVIISHHPLIFKPVNSIIAPKLINLIKNGITVMSFHTRLDIISGGINDLLACMLDLYGVISFAEGAGRIGTLTNPVLFDLFGGRLKNILGSDKINAVNACQNVYKVAVVSGSGGDFIEEAISLGADTFISGECGYHRLLDAKEAGINVFEAGHFFTERHAAGYIRNLLIKSDFDFIVDIYEKNDILSI